MHADLWLLSVAFPTGIIACSRSSPRSTPWRHARKTVRQLSEAADQGRDRKAIVLYNPAEREEYWMLWSDQMTVLLRSPGGPCTHCMYMLDLQVFSSSWCELPKMAPLVESWLPGPGYSLSNFAFLLMLFYIRIIRCFRYFIVDYIQTEMIEQTLKHIYIHVV
jgi:hypothetical protein